MAARTPPPGVERADAGHVVDEEPGGQAVQALYHDKGDHPAEHADHGRTGGPDEHGHHPVDARLGAGAIALQEEIHAEEQQVPPDRSAEIAVPSEHRSQQTAAGRAGE